MRVEPNVGPMGARVADIDLTEPLSESGFRAILRALGRHGVLCFPGQSLEPRHLSAFGARFGELEINVANRFHPPGHPEVMILSNEVKDGQPTGLADAGQLWHTDVSYARLIAFANVLHAKAVPMRDGRPLGDTEFRDMHAAYDDLPAEIKRRLDGRAAIHDFCTFWDRMLLRPGSTRLELTEEQRRARPPVSHPIFMTHPVTGRRVLYCNPGFATAIEGLAREESDAMLEFLFRHQLQDKYFYAHKWAVGDVLMWDDIGTIHNAASDYGPDTKRFMLRVQVMATLDYQRLAA
jgi:taurine dioxygenase